MIITQLSMLHLKLTPLSVYSLNWQMWSLELDSGMAVMVTSGQLFPPSVLQRMSCLR